MALVEIQNLSLELPSAGGPLPALEDLSLTIDAGETLCLVGESGSGKTLTALSLARLVPLRGARYPTGSIRVDGTEVLAASAQELGRLRGGVVGYVFQEPAAALHPAKRIGAQILEGLNRHRPELATRGQVVDLLRQVGISSPEDRFGQYPHQLSGGMLQRVMIAMALAPEPRVLVADEPTTALDTTIQALILELFAELRKHRNMAMLFITHHLAVASRVGDRIAVMYAGQIVESGPVRELLTAPLHPYTQALVACIPAFGAGQGRLPAIPGTPPTLERRPTGCRFHPRCPHAQASCVTEPPVLQEASTARWVRCPFWSNVKAPQRPGHG